MTGLLCMSWFLLLNARLFFRRPHALYIPWLAFMNRRLNIQDVSNLIVFSDLDGCLLNKRDYEWRAAEECLIRLADLRVPLVFASSKTVSEIDRFAAEVPRIPAPFIAENGGAICWGPLQGQDDEAIECTGTSRVDILDVLSELRTQFRFRSFQDLELKGVMAATQLPREKAERALDRQGTEPLLWDDSTAQRAEFESILARHDLTLTKGGRFWHVAGQATKGNALRKVISRYGDPAAVTVAIGDSPIDQSMLDVADVPVGIRSEGELHVDIRPEGIIPVSEGAQGWSEAVAEILDKFV